MHALDPLCHSGQSEGSCVIRGEVHIKNCPWKDFHTMLVAGKTSEHHREGQGMPEFDYARLTYGRLHMSQMVTVFSYAESCNPARP